MKQLYYYILLFVIFPNILFSQAYIIDYKGFTTEDGLSDIMATSIHKSTNGYLWIGTRYGLNRFDGYEFKLYDKESYNLYKKRPIRDIYSDNKQNLWLTYGNSNALLSIDPKFMHIDIFDTKTEKIISLEKYLNKKIPFKIADSYIPKIIDAKNRIWIISNETLYLYNGQYLQKIFNRKGLNPCFLTVDKSDNIYLGNKYEILQINLKGALQEVIPLTETLLGLWKEETKLWFVTNGSTPLTTSKRPIKIWCKKENQPVKSFDFIKNGQPLKIINDPSLFIHRDSNGFWYLYKNTLNIINPNGQWINRFDKLDSGQLRGDILYSISCPNYSWLTSNSGILKISIQENPFTLVHAHDEFSDCRTITEDKQGTIYFSNKKLYKFSPKQKKVSKLSEAAATHALIYDDGLVWSGTYEHYIIGFDVDLKTGKSFKYQSAKNDKKSIALTASKSVLSNQHLIGKTTGLAYINLKTKEETSFVRYNSFESLKKHNVHFIHRRREETWLATSNGLYLMSESEGILKHYNSKNSDLPFDHLLHIYEDEAGVFWISTQGGGIIKWQPPTAKKPPISKQFTVADGLSSNYTYAIYEDDFGRFWVSSDKGLMAINKVDFQINIYLVKDGLPHIEFNQSAHLQAADGTLYFGGLGGLVSFHPRQFEKNLNVKTNMKYIRYLKLKDNDKAMVDLTKELNNQNKIIIDKNTKFVELSFSLLDFDNTHNHIYAYKIEGYSDTWNYINENRIRITTLPYGTYKLRIKGKNVNSIWSENELILTIVSLRPFYFQWWFLLLISIIIGGLIGAYVQYRTFILRLEAEKLETIVLERTKTIKQDKETIEQQAEALTQLDKLKSQFFSNVTHELRTPLTLILAPLNDLIKKENLTESAVYKTKTIKQNTQKLFVLVDELLDLSKMEVNKLELNTKAVHLCSFIRQHFNTFQTHAAYRNIVWELNCTIAEDFVMEIDVKKVECIINNLLTNALKYTHSGGKVRMTVETMNDQIQIKVTDTGQGIHIVDLPFIFERYYQSKHNTSDEGGVGVGLALSYQYAQLFNGNIAVESDVKKGSTFTFTFPIIGENKYPLAKTEIKSPIQITSAKSFETSNKSNEFTILIAEDNLEMAEYLKHILMDKYNIILADNGKKSLKILAEKQIDFIISDVMMPEINGFEFLKIVKQNKDWKTIPFIILTAKVEVKSKLNALRIGVDDYIVKPFESEELRIRVENLLANYRVRIATKPIININVDKRKSTDNQWLEEMETIIKNNLSNNDFNVTRLAFELHVSERNLFDKMKSLVGMTPGQYLKEARLIQAKALLEAKMYNSIAEVCYAVGFKKPSYFSQIFKNRFGKSPSEY